MDELQLLCSSFGIGYIQLNKDDPTESQIIIKAPRTSLDWNMINRIANVNKDFQKYLDKQFRNKDFQKEYNALELEYRNMQALLNADNINSSAAESEAK